MILSSPVCTNGGDVPTRYTCDGEDVSPPLTIADIPEDVESLVLIMDDPDATDGGVFVHWTLWNIDAATHEIAEGDVPVGAIEGMTSFNKVGYGGPCPPKGAEPHRYFFKLYALDTVIDLDEGADVRALERAMEEQIIDTAQFIGRYGRPA